MKIKPMQIGYIVIAGIVAKASFDQLQFGKAKDSVACLKREAAVMTTKDEFTTLCKKAGNKEILWKQALDSIKNNKLINIAKDSLQKIK